MPNHSPFLQTANNFGVVTFQAIPNPSPTGILNPPVQLLWGNDTRTWLQILADAPCDCTFGQTAQDARTAGLFIPSYTLTQAGYISMPYTGPLWIQVRLTTNLVTIVEYYRNRTSLA